MAAQFDHGYGGRHLSSMVDWHDGRQQVRDSTWAEFNEGKDYIGPYPEGAEDSALVSVEDHKNNDEGTSVAGITEHSAAAQSKLQGLEKQPANQANAHFSATRLHMESWPELPSLNPTLGKNYSDDNIASTYVDFRAEPSLQKVTGNTTVQLDGEPEFRNDHHEKSNNFLDCDWGNIGDFDDFDRLFSSSDSMFVNEMVMNDSDFLSTSLDLMDNTVQSIPASVADANAKSGKQAESRNHLTCEYSGKRNQFSQEGGAQKRQGWSRRKLDARGKSKISSNISGFSQSKTQNPPSSLQSPMRPVQTPQYALLHDGKNMEQVQHPNQFMFPGYGYPVYPFPTIPLVLNIQAEDHQANPAVSSYRTATDSPKRSSSVQKSQDISSRPVTMTPQEKIEKLRRRQQMQALIAIQQQQQQFGQEGSANDTMLPQTYSPRNKNPDSLGGSIVIDENTNKVFSLELIPSCCSEVHKSSTVSEDPFIEETIYYQLQDALGKAIYYTLKFNRCFNLKKKV
ncbi:hypothetical protein PR202_gn00678 [Eleusine coracana subsp. coracana]|uniref:Protein LNK2 n=1 Tax=Eleusine coracana subsp. coracana TaxID=191504 RepID=A0AAV5G4I8_ELECO|nr:hypothetical protein PR202_gn00678 [Eleusine coracana subsp. coracana]